MTKRKPETECPFEPFADVPSEYEQAWLRVHKIAGKGCTDLEMKQEFHQFIDTAERDEKRHRNWLAAWRTWCRNTVKWARERPHKPRSGGKTPPVPVSNHHDLCCALAEGKQVRMQPGSYDTPQQLVDMMAAANWMNDFAAREGWPGRVVEVVKGNGFVERV